MMFLAGLEVGVGQIEEADGETEKGREGQRLPRPQLATVERVTGWAEKDVQ